MIKGWLKIKVTIADRLNLIMKERGLKQVDILEMCKPHCQQYNVRLEKNDLSQYVSGKYEPNQRKLTILALALKVNEVWLMGYDVPDAPKALDNMGEDRPTECQLQEQIQEQIQSTYGNATLQLVIAFQKLDEPDKIKIQERMEVFLESEKYNLKKARKQT